MRLVLFYGCVCAHVLCALGLYFLRSGDQFSMYAADPVFLCVAFYFGRQLAKSVSLEPARLRAVFLSALLPMILVVSFNLLSLFGTLFLAWMNSWAPPAAQVSTGGLMGWAGISVVAALSIVETCLLLSIYKSKRMGVTTQEDVAEQAQRAPHQV